MKYSNKTQKLDTGIWKKYGWGELGKSAGKSANKGGKEGLGSNPEPRAENKDCPSNGGSLGMGELDKLHGDFSLIKKQG
jgi:hypothetical protein